MTPQEQTEVLNAIRELEKRQSKSDSRPDMMCYKGVMFHRDGQMTHPTGEEIREPDFQYHAECVRLELQGMLLEAAVKGRKP